MSYTEVSEQGFFSRIKDAIVGVLVGMGMFLVAIAMLFYNEYDALYRANDLDEASRVVITVDAAKVDSANEGKLVHLTAKAETTQTLTDREFGVVQPATIKLERSAEMYQWEEEVKTRTEKKTGGKKVTIKEYKYRKKWSNSLINSSSFKESGHDNPSSMRYRDETFAATDVNVGAFKLTSSQISDIGGWETLPVAEVKQIPSGGRIDSDEIYFGNGSQASPQVGDIRVSFKVVKPQMISLYAGQRGNSFFPFKTSVGHIEHERLSMGSIGAKAMFDAAKDEAAMMKWIIRFVGFILMLIGVSLVFKPIQVMADVIPFIGDIVGMGLGFLAFAIAAPSALFTIGVAWILFRPLIGIIFLALGGAIFFGIFKMASGRKAAAAPAAATPPPVPEG